MPNQAAHYHIIGLQVHGFIPGQAFGKSQRIVCFMVICMSLEGCGLLKALSQHSAELTESPAAVVLSPHAFCAAGQPTYEEQRNCPAGPLLLTPGPGRGPIATVCKRRS